MEIKKVNKLPEERKRKEEIEGEADPKMIEELRKINTELREGRITAEQYRQERDKIIQEV